MRWLRKVAVLLAAGVALGAGVQAAHTVAVPAPAYAIDFCKEPTPSPPKRSAAGMISTAPDKTVEGNPFPGEGGPLVAIHDVYGYSWTWKMYDTGVACQANTDLGAVFNTTQAQLVMDWASTWVALLGLLESMAKDFGLQWFSEMAADLATKVVLPIVWGGASPNGQLIGLMPLAAITLGGWIAWRARKAQFAGAMRALMIFVGCVALAAWTLVVPATAATMLDSGVRTVATVAGSSFNASMTDGVNRNALYRAWLAGQFGDPDSSVAKDYGPRTLAATHYTWAEWAQIQADPDASKQIVKAKQDDYKAIAKEVEQRDPAAYEYFRGKADRVAPALFGFVSGAMMGLFALVAYFMILVARLMMQGLVIFAPLAATFGLLPRGTGPLIRMWDMFTAALLAVFKFTLAAGLMATVLGLMATLHPAAALIWMIVGTVVAFMILKPAHAFKSMVPGLDPNRSYSQDLAKLAMKAGGAAIGGAAGGAAAAKIMDATDKDDPGPREKVDLQASRPPMPAPTFTQVPGTHRHVAAPLDDATLGNRSALDAGPGGWRGVLAKELPAGPNGGGPGASPAGPDAGGGAPVLNVNTKLAITGGGPAKVEQSTEASGSQAGVVVFGEVVDVVDAPGGLYRRPDPVDIVDAEIIEAPAMVGARASDVPAGELMLYQSARPA